MALKAAGQGVSQFMRLAFLRSPNYAAGSTGWTINQDGSAEFNNVTIRGGLVEDGLVLIYNGAPAAGNLIASIADAAGTDSHTNAYKRGITDYAPGGQIVQIDGGQISFFATGVTLAGEIVDVGGSMTLQSSEVGVTDFAATLILQSKAQSNDGTASEIVLQSRVQVQDGFGNPGWIFTMDPASPNADENWHAITPGNGWTNSGNGPHFKCRLVASPPKTVEIIGDLTAGTLTNGTIIGALPSASYFPASNQQLMLVWPGTPPTSPGAGRLFVSTAGNIEAEDLAGAAGRCFFHGFVSLDA